jgi:hypothetical protein
LLKSRNGTILLSGGNPQVEKGYGDAPVQKYIAAMPGWKRSVGKRIHGSDQDGSDPPASLTNPARE